MAVNTCLAHSDNGSGKMTDNIALGTNIVQSMARQLNSKGIEYNDHGYHFQLEFYEKIVAKVEYKVKVVYYKTNHMI